jgi:hypothetical protein
MRYRLILLPFLERYHVTLTSWDSQIGDGSKRVDFWDIGPEDVGRPEIWALLAFVASEKAALAE